MLIDDGIKMSLITGGSDNFMMIMIGWMLMAMLMFFLRPSSMRNNAEKPQGNQTARNYWKLNSLHCQDQEETTRVPEILPPQSVRWLNWSTDDKPNLWSCQLRGGGFISLILLAAPSLMPPPSVIIITVEHHQLWAKFSIVIRVCDTQWEHGLHSFWIKIVNSTKIRLEESIYDK